MFFSFDVLKCARKERGLSARTHLSLSKRSKQHNVHRGVLGCGTEMKVLITAITILTLSTTIHANNKDSVDRFVGSKKVQIGFAWTSKKVTYSPATCYLFDDGPNKGWTGKGKDAVFRCEKRSGIKLWIKKVGRPGDKHRYIIGTGTDCALTWVGKRGTGVTHNAEFRCGKADSAADRYWIKPVKDGLFKIGFDNCPLNWKGSTSVAKNAEFRCGKAGDAFLINGDGCKMTNIEVLDSTDEPKQDGTEILGVVTAQSCSSGDHTLIFGTDTSVTDSISIGMAKTKEANWGVSQELSVTASVKVFGSGVDVTGTVGTSAGGSISVEASETKGKETSRGVSHGNEFTYEAPGIAATVAYVHRFKFDKSNVPARATITCEGGYTFTYDTSVKLKSTSYGQTIFNSMKGMYNSMATCQKHRRCLGLVRWKLLPTEESVFKKFKKCIPAGAGTYGKGDTTTAEQQFLEDIGVEEDIGVDEAEDDQYIEDEDDQYK